MSTKQQLEQIFGEIQESKWIPAARQRNVNRQWFTYSQEIAFAVLEQMDQKNISLNESAKKLNQPRQLVKKWLTGNENFTLEIISKIETVLEVKLLHIGIKIE